MHLYRSTSSTQKHIKVAFQDDESCGISQFWCGANKTKQLITFTFALCFACFPFSEYRVLQCGLSLVKRPTLDRFFMVPQLNLSLYIAAFITKLLSLLKFVKKAPVCRPPFGCAWLPPSEVTRL